MYIYIYIYTHTCLSLYVYIYIYTHTPDTSCAALEGGAAHACGGADTSAAAAPSSSCDHLSNLHFINSLETKQATTGAAERVIGVVCSLLKRIGS